MSQAANALYRKLPSVDELLRTTAMLELAVREGNAVVAEATRVVLARLREEIAAGHLDTAGVDLAVTGIHDAVERELRRNLAPSLRPVINATGVVLHTNLGRAPLSRPAIERIAATAGGYSNLEFDLETGQRGKRDVHVQRLFAKLLGPAAYEAHTVVVNNCAAAVLLALNTLAEGGEVIVSRGELVEIGGSFRVPEIMAKSGATLREVGTTNRTRIADYENAITERTRLLLRVHRSNFAIVGFTEQPSLEELVALGKKHKVPVLEDQGNGSLFDLRQVGVNNESGVMESLRAGVDVVTYSGDKLLGGPQAGILSGRKEWIAKIRSNALFRALRLDKLAYAALEATLAEYVRGSYDTVPALRMMRISADVLRMRAEALKARLRHPKLAAEVVAGESVIGGGTAPTATLPTFLLAVTHKDLSADELQARLRANDPPIIARVDEGRVMLDLRTVFEEQVAALQEALSRL
ncbi:MAG: L-seryl-tRNA(Sec) selenium transferase [Acidobacteriales bacterium]|nr:L-seryl-tRNA(Sec) selenium transferase [Terriglobales bacterium]